METYTTVKARGQDEFTERRSRFIGCAIPVTTEEEALAFISEQKTAYWDASHNVYAYLLREGQIRRYSDDGEPQGTAGIPVLEVLQKSGLTDVAVVVTRYFGGILLGAGGLVRAYSHGAKLAVDAAAPKRMSACTELMLEFDYSFYGKFSHILPGYHAVLLSSDFGALVRVCVLMEDRDVEPFGKAVTELSAALVTPTVLDRRFACLD